jgi:hypothetical protein
MANNDRQMESGQSHVARIPKFWSGICPKRYTHMDNSHAKGGYPANFGSLSALTHHTISLQMGLYPDLHVQKKRGKMIFVCKRA